MVFQGHAADRENAVSAMQYEIERFAKTRQGDRYFFACWDLGPTADQRKFIYESYTARKLTP